MLFEQTVDEGGKEKLGIAVENRDTNAHDDPVDITLSELEDAFAVAVKMVDAVKKRLIQMSVEERVLAQAFG